MRNSIACRSPISIATPSMRRWRNATILSCATSRSSSAAASAASSRRPATSPASAACVRPCPCSRRSRPVPEAVVMRPDMEKYARVGREVRANHAGAHAAGRADLDRRGLSRPLRHGAGCTATRRRACSLASPVVSSREIGITVSVGLSYCKFLAKVASDLRQAARLLGDRRGRSRSTFLADKPVTHDLGRRQGLRQHARKGRHPYDRPAPDDGARAT